MKIGTYEIQVPFVTTSTSNIKTILEFANIHEHARVIDLGSGDGRMVLEFAKASALADGYEIKQQLVEKAKQRIIEAHLEEKAKIYHADFWNVNLSKYDVIYIYGMGSIMGRLEKKLEAEMKPRAKFISNVFRLPHWKVKKEKNHVFLYMKG